MKKTLLQLHKQHPAFKYLDFALKNEDKDLLLNHSFELEPDIKFETHLKIKNLSNLPSANQLQNWQWHAFNLGMVESISYWKAALPPLLQIKSPLLDPDQTQFWGDLFIKGLGEFFYVNDINPMNGDFLTIEAPDYQVPDSPSPLELDNNKVLVPLGGGKDSLVTLEILKRDFPGEIVLFSLNPTPAVREIVKLHPHLKYIEAERVIDPQLIKLNQAGYMNGHTPFSAYVAFLTHFVASLEGIKYIALSNEASANQASLNFHGLEVNHQYSKSFEFEEDFNLYTSKYFAEKHNPTYFSLLRPWNELQIASMFSTFPEYFDIFVSCNRGQRQGTWCGDCPKCTFAWLMLAPYLDEDQLKMIFNVDILSNRSNIDSLKELVGLSRHKPLECVGTYEESQSALFLLYQKVKQYDQRLSNMLENEFGEVVKNEEAMLNQSAQILANFNSTHHLPAQFDRIMSDEHHNRLISRLKKLSSQ
jgi:hypothetical protein